jgi:hypothetical protein
MAEDRIKLFMERCVDGDASPGDISLYIREWRDKDSDEALEDYLGMTFEEFEAWLDDPKSLPQIIAARKSNIPLSDYLQKVYDYPHQQREASDEDTEKE